MVIMDSWYKSAFRSWVTCAVTYYCTTLQIKREIHLCLGHLQHGNDAGVVIRHKDRQLNSSRCLLLCFLLLLPDRHWPGRRCSYCDHIRWRMLGCGMDCYWEG